MNDRETVQMIAMSDGHHLPPRYYKEQAKLRFNREVSSSTVTKSIGSYVVRLSVNDKPLVTKAKELLASCRYDAGYANHILQKAIIS
jgi:hypothetical protein